MIRKISILIFSSIFYLIFFKPLRLLINEHIILPLLKSLLSHYDISIPKADHTEVLIQSFNNGNEMMLQLPFNGFYIIPTMLMLIEKNFDHFTMFTLIHFALIIFPLLFFLIGVDLPIILTGSIFHSLFVFFSLLFTILLLNQEKLV